MIKELIRIYEIKLTVATLNLTEAINDLRTMMLLYLCQLTSFITVTEVDSQTDQ
jgi:hypothetical protein